MCDTDRDSARAPKQIIYPPILNTKGLQCLSRRVNIKRAEESGTFDWEEQPQNKESFSLKERCQLRQECYKSETGTINQDAGCYSCPKLLDVWSDKKISEQAVNVAKQGVKNGSVNANCVKKLVGDVNIISPNLELGKIEDETDGEPFLTGVGFDTQLAAEAMEALLHDPPNSNACYTHKIPSGIIDQSSEVAAMSKKTGNGTATASGQHLKGKRSANKFYENESCLSGECDPYLRGHSCSSAPKKKLKENGSSVYINLDDEKLQGCRTSCRSKAQQRKRSPENIQGRTSPKPLRPNYLDGLFERNTRSSSIIPKRKRSKPLGNKRQLDFKPRDSRRWISSATVSVLFSQNLSSKTTRQLKKILARLGFSEVSCCSAATHFIADKFVRTKNMLEALAFGKLVVTPSWLESCGQAGYLIAEKSYILRDAKKEKEFGFSMPVSLACASQRPLLQGQRVLVTPNVKPNKDLIQTLVKAVQGQEVDDFQLAQTKESAVSPDLLIISCEEDYGYCVPFLERGIAIYSSELLLNGIIIQKLEYERHRILMNYHTTTSSEKEKKGEHARRFSKDKKHSKSSRVSSNFLSVDC
ncbi:hypothetical protein LIER_42615 [Lithospermum erythrorhizon]|uniref:BRCT domain-containing protein n=1 Tax=Lithospermum erythrorhizon TaxID=34254 RepID=A0AAV3NRI1_LITER